MTISKLFTALALSAAMSLAGAQAGAAQSLSDASLMISSGWSSGYMGLGGNLGTAIEHRHRNRAKPVRSAKASRPHHRVERHHARVERTSFRPQRRESPSYLIAQSLDHSGLTINTLRLQQFP